jgi:adenosylmethionine-8-amino-7-oxononanoate aminotransferase
MVNRGSNADPVFQRELGRDYPTIDRGEGIHLYDMAGKRYIDGAGGVFVTNLGHGNQHVIEALVAQARRVSFAHTGTFTSQAAIDFAAKLLELAPQGFAKVWMSTSGSAANETAIKLARQYHLLTGNPEKTRIVARWNSYHGSTLGALSLTGQPRRREPFEPYLLDFPHIDPPYCYRCPLGKDQATCHVDCADELEKAIRLVGPQYVSAFIVEPVAGGPLGALVSPDGYFRRIREICDRYNVLLIVDEVVSGIGRTGRNFGVDHSGVIPDLITVAKGVGGGYVPIGATLVHQRIYAAFEEAGSSFRHGETFTGHALVCAVGLATLQEIERNRFVECARTIGDYFGKALDRLRGLPIVGDVRGRGLLRGIELVRDKATKAPFARSRQVAERVVAKAASDGLLILANSGCVDGVDGDTLALAPPFVVNEADIDEIVGILSSAIQSVASSELAGSG